MASHPHRPPRRSSESTPRRHPRAAATAAAGFEDADAQMVKTGFDPRTCRAKRPRRAGDLPGARRLFDEMLHRNTFTLNLMMSGYAKSGGLREARSLFEETSQRNKITWTVMMGAYAKSGLAGQAFVVFVEMMRSGTKPDHVAVVTLLSACDGAGASSSVAQVHAQVGRLGHGSKLIVCNTLVDAYCKCGLLEDASRLFGEVICKDSVTFNAMLMGYSREGRHTRALELLLEMRRSGLKASQFTFSGSLSAATGLGDLGLGRQIHGAVIKSNFCWNVFVGNALLDFYSKADCFAEMVQLFLDMPEMDNVSYNVLISGFASAGRNEDSLELFRELQSTGFDRKQFPFASVLSVATAERSLSMGRQLHAQAIVAGAASDVLVSNSLVDMYAKCGDLATAGVIFESRTDRNTVSWTAMISGYIENGLFEEALGLFSAMRRSGQCPDRATFSSVLRAAASLALAGLGRQLHSYLVRFGYTSNVYAGSALVDMYAKCGCLRDTEQAFGEMPSRNIVSWNAMMSAYAHSGRGGDAVALLDRMRRCGVEPDSVTFLCALSACSHGGLVDEGLRLFRSMRTSHFLPSPAGSTTAASSISSLATEAPFDEPDPIIWSSILNSCRIHRNQDLARRAAERLFGMELRDAAPYVIMSNIYAAAGRWEEGVRKEPAFSWVEVGRAVHRFMSDDDAHPQIGEVRRALDELSGEMERRGYRADTSWALHNVPQREAGHRLRPHEHTGGAPVRVMKNLRACADCHAAIKVISLIVRREITVRDSSRFHHFRDGFCSCADYW
ncbi:unnamed protein product [Spirodela intermedia]|uniref:DYW domain-containing protein n=1 Tax=Spirodela intermedia TaxID=51605 RepID=A0A7I8IEH5_SPIIN|nr:unnamed protein product [Spirodela intermedia]CAA6655272.1 unnamed protein product [Spirodela intermedia]